ncbi:hypothetical protein GCM10012275_34970 [Longimycelium tulufanense]|uniref:Uncharacterized protein n=1 Tax=Longimycelium tulufanense TaxID=907463 RepID=A0A8J3C9M9_9PSEU|nr:hypothetical protein [Longimycelium tulufanense]GGM60934.1 hypothetical protein GCM10012275_34970 [Longimycelium tulufanense]
MTPAMITIDPAASPGDGLACVMCERGYLRICGSRSVPAGRSATGSRVFAEVKGCVEAAGVDPVTTGRRVGGGLR